jgi:hypothetical protein
MCDRDGSDHLKAEDSHVGPVWLREKLKAGATLEDFAVHKTAAFRKASPKKRRRAKR